MPCAVIGRAGAGRIMGRSGERCAADRARRESRPRLARRDHRYAQDARCGARPPWGGDRDALRGRPRSRRELPSRCGGRSSSGRLRSSRSGHGPRRGGKERQGEGGEKALGAHGRSDTAEAACARIPRPVPSLKGHARPGRRGRTSLTRRLPRRKFSPWARFPEAVSSCPACARRSFQSSSEPADAVVRAVGRLAEDRPAPGRGRAPGQRTGPGALRPARHPLAREVVADVQRILSDLGFDSGRPPRAVRSEGRRRHRAPIRRGGSLAGAVGERIPFRAEVRLRTVETDNPSRLGDTWSISTC